MKIAYVKLTKRDLNWLILVIGLLFVVGVLGYSSSFSGGNPVTMGHSSDEINVKNSTGYIMTLQDYINKTKIQHYFQVYSCDPATDCTVTKFCGTGEVVVGGGCSGTFSGAGYLKSSYAQGSSGAKFDRWYCQSSIGASSLSVSLICARE